jgi:pyrroline-5-carboxylate reductase
MGVAILSGVLDNIASPSASAPHASGDSTPSSSQQLDPQSDSLPNRFIACVHRDETVRKLSKLWKDQPTVQVRNGRNVEAVGESDVVLLWCVAHAPLHVEPP